jgi:hypothetical protein
MAALPLTRDSSQDVVKAGALRLTLGTQVGTAIAAVVTSVNPIFGDSFRPGLKTAIIIASIAAFTLVTVADVFARTWATVGSQPQIAVAPKGVNVRYIPVAANEETGWTMVATRTKVGDPPIEFLIVKHGQAPLWARPEDLGLS